jgi:hypothetical protein
MPLSVAKEAGIACLRERGASCTFMRPTARVLAVIAALCTQSLAVPNVPSQREDRLLLSRKFRTEDFVEVGQPRQHSCCRDVDDAALADFLELTSSGREYSRSLGRLTRSRWGSNRQPCGKCKKPPWTKKKKTSKARSPYRPPSSCSGSACLSWNYEEDDIRLAGRDPKEKVQRWVPPVGVQERYLPGQYTLSGGVAQGAEIEMCETLAMMNGECPIPCGMRGAQDRDELWLPKRVELQDSGAWEVGPTGYGKCLKRRAHGKPLTPQKLKAGIAFLGMTSSVNEQRVSRISSAGSELTPQAATITFWPSRSAPITMTSGPRSGSNVSNFLSLSSALAKKGPGGDEWQPEFDDKAGECVCTDPCTLYTSCQECTANKRALDRLLPGRGPAPIDCGWCGDRCISGSDEGPGFMQACSEQWKFDPFQCDDEVTFEEVSSIVGNDPESPQHDSRTPSAPASSREREEGLQASAGDVTEGGSGAFRFFSRIAAGRRGALEVEDTKKNHSHLGEAVAAADRPMSLVPRERTRLSAGESLTRLSAGESLALEPRPLQSSDGARPSSPPSVDAIMEGMVLGSAERARSAMLVKGASGRAGLLSRGTRYPQSAKEQAEGFLEELDRVRAVGDGEALRP